MKGGGGGGKRRWRGLAIGVLGLIIFLSMLVPLGFLLGFHSAFHSSPSFSGYITDQLGSTSKDTRIYDKYGIGSDTTPSPIKQNHSEHVDKLLKKLEPAFPKDLGGSPVQRGKYTTHINASHDAVQGKGFSGSSIQSANDIKVNQRASFMESNKGSLGESTKLCELRFGTYCLWRQEHKEELKDGMVRKMKDRLFVARAYFPSIAKIQAQDSLSRELKQNIQDFERVLSEASRDADLPTQIEEKLKRMDSAIAKAKSCTVEYSNVDKKFRQLLDLTEDEANFHMKQSAFLYQVAVQTIPKGIHCLNMRLTVDYFRSPEHNIDIRLAEKFSDPTLHHFVIFSKNVLASAVVINSTVKHAKDSRSLVFHVLTDGQNFYSLQQWFFGNAYKDYAIQVLNIENLDLENYDETTLQLYLPEEFRISFHSINNESEINMRTEYVSTFSHSHYFLPDIFPRLEKVVVLDDDDVVQKDLTALWSLNMGGKVNGASELCSVRLGQLSSYVGDNNLDRNSCTWMSGLNVIDLARWRDLKLTQTYQSLVQQQPKEAKDLFEYLALRRSLLTFQDLTFTLDNTWVLSGLGHNYKLDAEHVKRAAVLHYNGKMKPWLELAIPRYKEYWKRFLNWDHQILSDCNIHP